jgi:hypothetical protein
MNLKVISGGQTGADQAGLRAAKKAGIPTGGYMPWGYLTEAGYDPSLAVEFGLEEHPDPTYSPRTRKNIEAASFVIWFGDLGSPGAKLTCRLAREASKVVLDVTTPSDVSVKTVALWINEMSKKFENPILMVAGNRERGNLGIGQWVETFLDDVFSILKGLKR